MLTRTLSDDRLLGLDRLQAEFESAGQIVGVGFLLVVKNHRARRGRDSHFLFLRFATADRATQAEAKITETAHLELLFGLDLKGESLCDQVERLPFTFPISW